MSLIKLKTMTAVGLLLGFLLFFVCYWWIGSISMSVVVGLLVLIAAQILF